MQGRQMVPYTIEQGVPKWGSTIFLHEEAINCSHSKETKVSLYFTPTCSARKSPQCAVMKERISVSQKGLWWALKVELKWTKCSVLQYMV